MVRWVGILLIFCHTFAGALLALPHDTHKIKSVCGDVLTDVQDNEQTNSDEDSLLSGLTTTLPAQSHNSVSIDEGRTLVYFIGKSFLETPVLRFTFLSLKDDMSPPEHIPDVVHLPS